MHFLFGASGITSPSRTIYIGNKRQQTMIDIEKRKKEITVMLDKLELDIKTLQDDILRLRTDIANVDENTNLKKFDEEHNLERNLKYIRLYW